MSGSGSKIGTKDIAPIGNTTQHVNKSGNLTQLVNNG